jgi:uncharacterized membrane protein YphA (DoxX/SURF4 family)
LRWLGLLLLCAAYIQGGVDKLVDFEGAIIEMQHFGLSPPGPMAVAVIVLELGASLAILTGYGRWLGALTLAGFTVLASCRANNFWAMAMPVRIMAENAFFEHLGLAGGFLIVAWHDVRARSA